MASSSTLFSSDQLPSRCPDVGFLTSFASFKVRSHGQPVKLALPNSDHKWFVTCCKSKDEGQESSIEKYQSTLANRIASGEFTVKTKWSVGLSEIRNTFANFGPPGRYLAKSLAKAERQWRLQMAKEMPAAQGDVRAIVGEPFFLPLYRLFLTYGGVFRLNFGPKSFVIVSDADVAMHILKNNAKAYSKGILAEILYFVMGTGLIPADGEVWKVRRRAIVPSLHRKFVAEMVNLFGKSTERLCNKLSAAASNGEDVEMESLFSRLTLDVIGKAVFNYDFDSLTHDAGIVEAVYVALREAEDRSTAVIPYWNFPFAKLIFSRQRKVADALELINKTLDDLIDNCKRIVAEEDVSFHEEYMNDRDPSILHFLMASGGDVSSKQLRDDLMTLLIAGHETSAAVLTWTFYLLAKNPTVMAKLQREIDSILGDRIPTTEDMKRLKYTTRVINESLRLYPQPPVLIRRALQDDMLGPYYLRKGEDIFIAIWNIHRSPSYWDNPEEFRPERWAIDGPDPSEVTENFRYLPFGGGQRKCIGDIFATFETITATAMLVQRFNFELAVNAPPVGMATGATIHTTAGLKMTVTERIKAPVIPVTDVPSVTTVSEDGSIKTYKGDSDSVSTYKSKTPLTETINL